MTRQKTYLGLIMGGMAATMIGCGTPVTPADSGTTDTSTTDTQTIDSPATDTPVVDTGTTDTGPRPDAGPGMEYWYAVNALTIDQDMPSNPYTGFNLDGRASDINDDVGCFHDDYFSALDPDQNCTGATACTGSCMMGAGGCLGGVDNQLPALAATIQTAAMQDVRALLADQINNNKITILARLSDVQSLTADDSVTVRLYLGYPTRQTNCTSVVADSEYVVDSDSLMPGATSVDQAKFTFTGSIVGGRLRVGGNSTQFILPLPVMGQTLELALSSTQLRLNVTATAGTQGNLGGYVLGSQVVTAVTMLAPDFATVVQGAIGGFVDVQVNGICDDPSMNPHAYGGIAVGLGLTTTSARLAANPIVADRPVGACGASNPGG